MCPPLRPLRFLSHNNNTHSKHRYVFIAAKEPPSYAGPQNKNYPLNGPADLKDRIRWNASEYIQVSSLAESPELLAL